MNRILFCLLFLTLSCQKVREPEVTQAPFDPIEVAEYESPGEEFESVTIFTWKKPVPPVQEVTETMELARKYELLRSELKKLREELREAQSDPAYPALLSQRRTLGEKLALLTTAISGYQEAIARDEPELLQTLLELDEEQQKDSPDRDKIRSLREKVKELRRRLARNKELLKGDQGAKAALDSRLAAVEQELAPIESAIEDAELAVKSAQQEQQQLASRLNELTDWPVHPPEKILIREGLFPEHPELTILNWQLHDEENPRTLSSTLDSSNAEPGIYDVRFSRLGGRLSFIICREGEGLVEAWRIKLRRIQSDDGDSERIAYTGTVVRNAGVPGSDCRKLAELEIEGRTLYGVIQVK